MPGGGIQSEILEILTGYEKIENLKISLITKYSEYKPISNKVDIHSIRKFRASKINTISFYLKSFLKPIQIHRNNPIHVIHIHSFYYDIVPSLLLHVLFKIPLLLTVPTDFNTFWNEIKMSRRVSIGDKMMHYGWMKFFKFLINKRKNINIQAVNKKSYSNLVNLKCSKDKLIMIPNGISVRNNLSTHKADRAITHFGYVGRLIKSKNLGILLKSFIKYLSKYPNDKLFFYGEGSEEKPISKFITKNNLKKNIILCGFEKNKEKIYSNLDVLINPSFGEGISLTILEASLTNTLIIASCVSGNKEIIKHKENGLLFNPFNENDLLKQILFYKENQTLILNFLKNAKNKVLKCYDIDIIAENIVQFLKSKL